MDILEITESLSPHERAILPNIKNNSLPDISKKSALDEVSAYRALQYLENKSLIKISKKKENIIQLGENGKIYAKTFLPERKLLNFLKTKKKATFQEMQKIGIVSPEELKVSIGALKSKALLSIKDGNLILTATDKEADKKMFEELLLEKLPISYSELKDEFLLAFNNLKQRKNIILTEEKNIIKAELTEKGIGVLKAGLKNGFVEKLTPEIIKSSSIAEKKFRRYDIKSQVPEIYGGRRQRYYTFLEDIKRKLVELGFKEMTGNTIVSEFWNFDALFQPQFHAARDWSDTYQIKNLKIALPEKKIVDAVRTIHEKKWKYLWNLEKSKNAILRPQATAISAKTLSTARDGKFFAIARVYRPDITDAKHLSEFNQVEGIVIGKNLSMANLLNTLKIFATNIAGAKEENIRFRPSYFPFTEPSIELDIKHEKLGWIEIGGAGIFRKEVAEPLTEKKDEELRVLAWGLGIDRLAMLKLNIADIRELFSQNLEYLRGGNKK
ncbi:MAG: phenylalanine--tRNA ligase subunit alpha [Nanoarchaeota archaeon]